MSDRYKGGILSGTAPTVTQQSANGVYTLSQELQYQGQGVWPAASQNPILQSLRFRSSASAYLSRTLTTPTNQKIWTWSGWVKRSNIGSTGALFGGGTSGSNYGEIYFSNDNFSLYNAATTTEVKTAAVYRDPSAWYHLIVAVDTTQATSSNRVKLYVNGAQVTSLSASSYPSQNADLYINSANIHSIGSLYYTASNTDYLDGYLTEVNFIDGVQLTPSSFGTTDVNGIWQPIPYTGAYGTNGFYLPFRPASASYSGVFSGSSQWVSVPNLAAFSVGTSDYTVEGWFYFNSLPSSQGLFGCDNGAGSTPKFMGLAYSNGSIGLEFTNTGGVTFLTSSAGVVTTGKWYHIAWVRNSGTSTIYVNGVNVGSTATSVNLAGLTQAWNIGYIGEGGPSSLVGYASNFRLVTGTAVYTANFTPPTSALTAISGTQILTLQNATLVDNSSNAQTVTNTGGVTLTTANPFLYSISLDYSGNGNNWAPNNISLTAGVTYDSMLDSPSNASSTIANYCVLSPIDTYDNPPTQGNLARIGVGHTGSPWSTCRGTLGVSSGKWYFEATLTGSTGGTSNNMVGIMTTTTSTLSDAYGGSTTRSYQANGGLQGDGSTGTVASAVSGDVIMIAYDVDASKMWVGKNGTWQNSGNPVTGAGPVFTYLPTSPIVPQVSMYGNTGDNYGWYTNFGQQPFVYTPPTGFNRLNTYNLPVPTIPAGNKVMDATIWTGVSTSSAITISNLNFQPDLVWGKPRSQAYSHSLSDSVRGANKRLSSQNTDVELTNFTYGYTSSFNSNGFTASPGATDNENWNETGQTFVAWCWNAGNGVTSSNTNGSITSTVSVNPVAGFSVVTYTGNNTLSTVGHGLGVAPSMIIVKDRTSSNPWIVYHASLGVQYYTLLSSSDASYNNLANYWSSVPPSSTVFGINAYGGVNTNSDNYVAYCFAPVAGYSAFGSYTGNGSTDGAFVYTGFRPAFIMIKRTDTGGTDWVTMDYQRLGYNATDVALNPNAAYAENSGYATDFTANGFKLRTTTSFLNGSGATYIYMAFASSPFKIARAR